MDEAETIQVVHLDDDPEFAELAADFLEQESARFVVDPVSAPDAVLTRLAEGSVDCIVSDYDMPDLNGLEVLHEVREEHPNVPFILFTGKGSEEVASEAISAGVTDYLQKDIGTDQFSVLANRIEQVVEKHRTERQLRVSRDRRAALFQNANQAIVEIQFEAGEPVIQDVNPGFEETFDFVREEVIDRPVEEVLVPEAGTERHSDIVDQVLDGHEVETEVERQTADGLRTFLLRVFPLEDFHGRRVSYAIYMDITDRKTRERRLQTFQDVVENSGHSIYLTDRNGVIQYVNSAFEATTGYPEDEAIGRTPRILKSGLHDEAFYADLWETITAGEVWHSQVVNERKDGDRYRVNQTITPIEDDAGRIEHFVAINAEVTDPTTAPRDRGVEWVGEVFAHELRNPVNLAELRLETLENDHDGDAVADLRTVLERLGRRLDRLERLFGGRRTEANREPVDITGVAERGWQSVSTDRARLSIPDPGIIRADPGSISHVFENLFQNAVDHCGDDVHVRVGTTDDGFYVSDDGPGIPENRRLAIFNRDYSTKDGNTGLGLTVVAHVIESHGWEIDVTTSREGGTRFEITGVEVVDSRNSPNSVVNS